MQIVLIVEFELHPGSGDSFDAIMRAHAKATLETEPGCRRFDLLQPVEDDGTPQKDQRTLFELYDDQAALEAHIATPRFATVRDAYAPLVRNRRIVRCMVPEL